MIHYEKESNKMLDVKGEMLHYMAVDFCLMLKCVIK